MMFFLKVVVVILPLLLSGCGTHYVITSKYLINQKTEAPPEVIETQTYKDEISNIKTVALKAPSSCSDRTADQRTGRASTNELVLGTRCAVDMAEIERALTKASFKVISWTALEREMGRYNQSQADQSPLKIAEGLGAQILFQINSLEISKRTIANIGRNEAVTYEYYEADENGKIIGKKEFTEDEQQYLKTKFFDINDILQNAKIPFVTFDANVIYVKTGETIWFYRWTHSYLSYEYPQDKFIYCKPPLVCGNDTPSNKKDVSQNKSSSDFQTRSAEDRPEDREKAIQDILIKEVIDNFVSSYSKR